MKYTIIKLLVLVCCIPYSFQTQAQTNIFPSQDRVEQLLQEIADCKTESDLTEKRINFMKANASNYTLEDYLSAQELLEEFKNCLSENREELDRLRKDYPGWFNQPSLSMPLSKGHETTPRDLEAQLKAIAAKMDAVLKQWEGLPKPDK